MDELEKSGTNMVIERSSDADGTAMIRLQGELDISNADSFRSAVEEVVAEAPGRLVFDLSELTFMDSSGIAVMVYAANNVEAVELRHATTIVRRVVEATGLSDILRLDPS
jgi:anti-sigma B factor antagonist